MRRSSFEHSQTHSCEQCSTSGVISQTSRAAGDPLGPRSREAPEIRHPFQRVTVYALGGAEEGAEGEEEGEEEGGGREEDEDKREEVAEVTLRSDSLRIRRESSV